MVPWCFHKKDIVVMSPAMLLFLLIGAHMLADYPFQGDFLSKAKNKYNPIPGVPWQQAMLAHVVIHGMFVALLTQWVVLGVMEAIVHWIIDNKKCAGKISYNTDQALHILCKVIWWSITLIILF